MIFRWWVYDRNHSGAIQLVALAISALSILSFALGGSQQQNLTVVEDKSVQTGLDGKGSVDANSTKTRRRRFPDVILAGVKKGGTKFLQEALRTHSKLVMPWNETHFFDHFGRYDYNYYLDKFPLAGEDQLVVEKTPRYFTSHKAPGNMSMLPDVKVLICLRNPVERTISDYLMYARVDKQSGSMEEMILDANGNVNASHNLVLFSTYAHFMPRWLALFRLGERLEVVDGDNLIRNPWEELERVQRFLQIPLEITRESFVYSEEKGFYCVKRKRGESADVQCLPDTKGHDHADVISREMAQKLVDFFKPHNERLFEMLGRRYEWKMPEHLVG